MSVQGSSRQSKAEVQAEKNWLSQTCLSILEIFWYLWYPGDPPRDAESLGRSLYLWGAVYHEANRDARLDSMKKYNKEYHEANRDAAGWIQ